MLRAKAVLIATGADYGRLEAEGREQFEGVGVYYAATALEGQLCRNETVVVAGSGNSAGQAAMFLSDGAAKVLLVVRGNDIANKMSDYLSRRVQAQRKHRDSLQHRDSKDVRRKKARTSRIGKYQDRRASSRSNAGSFFHDRRSSMHRVVAGGNRAGRKRIHQNRQRTSLKHQRGAKTNGDPPARNQSPGNFRSR